MYQWCCVCLWQTMVPICINACPHLNKPEFQPLSQVLFACNALGSWSPLWKQINLQSSPVHKQFTMITVVTPWIRSPLLQLTMADPVKVMLVTNFGAQCEATLMI